MALGAPGTELLMVVGRSRGGQKKHHQDQVWRTKGTEKAMKRRSYSRREARRKRTKAGIPESPAGVEEVVGRDVQGISG
jgi:hypothetical protein